MTSAPEKSQTSPGHGATDKRYELLVEIQERLTAQLRALSKTALSDSEKAGEDSADAGSEAFLRETELALLGEEGKRLSLVQSALQRFDEGTYGKCLDCGKTIEPARIDAIPYAQFCMTCEKAREANDGLPPPGEDGAGDLSLE